MLELAHPLDAMPQPSPLAAARERRGLSVAQVSYRSGLSGEETQWPEEGRLYRFPSQSAAALAAVLYSTGLGIDRYEARRLAGLPVGGSIRVNAKARLIVVGAVAALLSALAGVVVTPNPRLTRTRTGGAIPNASLVPPWKLNVTVENGNGDISWTRAVASKIGAMGYTIAKVSRADRFDYPVSTVYYGSGGRDVALRLGRQLRVATREAPGLGKRELLVVVGPKTVAQQ